MTTSSDKSKTKTPAKTSANTPVGAAGKAPTTNLKELFAQRAALGGSAVSSGGAVYTQQEGDYAVQNVYQQLLGRNAMGKEYQKALSIAMGQSQDTSSYGRQQAIMNYVMETPEYINRSQNRWLDAIYNDLQKKIGRAR